MGRNDIILILFFWLLVGHAIAQCPTGDIDLGSASVCINQPVTIESTIEADQITWDFCSGELAVSPALETLDLLPAGSYVDVEIIEENGTIYFFILDQDGKLVRLIYQNGIENTPAVENLGDVSGLMSSGNQISLLQEGNQWYGLVARRQIDSNIILLSFPNGISEPPIATDLGNFNGKINTPSGLSIKQQGTDIIAVIVNQGDNSVSTINFGNSLANTVDESNVVKGASIAGASSLFDLAVNRNCDKWYGFTVSRTNGDLIQLDFGTDISSIPLASSLALPGVSTLNQIEMGHDGEMFRGFVGRRENFYRLDFENGIDQSPTVQDLSSVGIDFALGVHIFKDSLAYAVNNSTGDLLKLTFDNNCSASSKTFEGSIPVGINYGQNGLYKIGAKAIDVNGNTLYRLNEITVTSLAAPIVQIVKGLNQCIANTSSFDASTISGVVDTYSWKLNGDDIPDSDLENVIYQYDTIGVYPIQLDIAGANGCENFALDTVRIYPEPPITDFNVIGNLCSNAELMLVNSTDEDGYDDILSYEWDIDGDLVFESDPAYVFDGGGDKTIRLRSSLPGCVSEFTEQTITLASGPLVSFNFSNNCFGEVISFDGEVIGDDITSTNWDFGDGLGTSEVEDPAYLYGTAGEYDVILQVTNDMGCTTSYSRELTVNDQPLVGFDYAPAVVNLPVELSGIDRTLAGDLVTSWTWSLDGLDFDNEKNTSITFNEIGENPVSLSVTTSQGCLDSSTQNIVVEQSPCPTIDFSIDGAVCLNEPLDVLNRTVNAEIIRWDFCAGELGVLPELSSSDMLPSGSYVDLKIVQEDDSIYAFVLDQTGQLIRINYSDGFESSASIENLGSFGGILDQATKIDIIKEENEWLGLVTRNLNQSNVILLSFPEGISGIPNATDLGNMQGKINSPSGLTIARQASDMIALIVNQGDNTISSINFGSSLANSVDSSDVMKSAPIVGVSSLFDLTLVKECNLWYGFTVSRDNGDLVQLNFDSNLNNAPQATVYSLAGVSTLNQIEIRHDGEMFRGFAGRREDFFRLDFTMGISQLPSVVDLSALGFDFALGVTIYKDTLVLAVNNSTSEVLRLDFVSNCSASVKAFAGYDPIGISFSDAGPKKIGVEAEDANGNISYLFQEAFVSTDSSPVINQIYSENICISSPSALAADISSAPVTSYVWDFGNDITSTEPSPTIQFDTAGTYPIRLDVVADNGCTNFATEDISIYEPPVASFVDLNEVYCAEEAVLFSNTSTFDGPDSLVTYQWNFDGQLVAAPGDTSFVFSSAGSKLVELSAAIPGCSTDTAQSIVINASPQPDFSWQSDCFNETTSFFNNTTDQNIDSYNWDFGDGTLSTQVSPEHFFAAPGNYIVRLTAINDAGCDNFTERSVIIHALPEVGFESEIGCVNQSLQFTDSSLVANANIVDWSWDFAGLGTATEQNPTFTFAEPGNYEVTLTTTSNFGCQNTATQTVIIRKAPPPVFSIDQGCFGEPVVFEDITPTDNETVILDYRWVLDGRTFTTEDVSYVFPEPGEYDVTLTVDYINLCSATSTERITVLGPIVPDFEFTQPCDNNTAFFTDTSTVPEDSIISWTWDFAGLSSANGRQAQFAFPEAGDYEVSLQVTSAKGCVASLQQTVSVEEAPQALFSASTDFGAPPLNVDFVNESIGATSFIWSVNGEVVSDSSVNLNYTLPAIGIYEIGLEAFDSLGCSTSTSLDVRVDIPAYDLAIQEIQDADQQQQTDIILRISNLATVDVEGISLEIELADGIILLEPVNAKIPYQSSIIYTLNTSLPLNSPLESICINLPTSYQGLVDPTPINNEACVNLLRALVIGEPYPNPGDGRTNLDIVLPNDGSLTLELLNINGQQLLLSEYEDLSEGLQKLFLDYTAQRQGMYFLRVYFEDQLETRRIVINR